MTALSHHHGGDARRCSVVLVDDRPLIGAALAGWLHCDVVHVADVHGRGSGLCRTVMDRQPHTLVLTNGLTELARRLLPGFKVAIPDLATVVVAETVDDVRALYGAGLVDAVLGPEAGVEQLRRAIDRVRAGERFITEVARRPSTAPSCVELTDRERQVLDLLAAGADTATIAVTLGVSVNTVRTHVQSVLRKLGAGRRLRAVRRAEELGLLSSLTG